MPTSFFRSTAAVAAVGVGALAFLAAPASAQTCYPPTLGCVTTTSSVAPSGVTLSLTDTTVTRGQTIGATAGGFRAGSSGILTVASVEQQIGSFTVPASGTSTVSITIPSSISLGSHTVFARGTSAAGLSASASQAITVVAGSVAGNTGSTGSTGGTGSSLARTGVIWLLPATILGAAFVAGGIVLKRSGKRGRARTAA